MHWVAWEYWVPRLARASWKVCLEGFTEVSIHPTAGREGGREAETTWDEPLLLPT